MRIKPKCIIDLFKDKSYSEIIYNFLLGIKIGNNKIICYPFTATELNKKISKCQTSISRNLITMAELGLIDIKKNKHTPIKSFYGTKTEPIRRPNASKLYELNFDSFMEGFYDVYKTYCLREFEKYIDDGDYFHKKFNNFVAYSSIDINFGDFKDILDSEEYRLSFIKNNYLRNFIINYFLGNLVYSDYNISSEPKTIFYLLEEILLFFGNKGDMDYIKELSKKTKRKFLNYSNINFKSQEFTLIFFTSSCSLFFGNNIDYKVALKKSILTNQNL